MCALVTEEPMGAGWPGYVKVSLNGVFVLVLHEERCFLNPAPLCRRANKDEFHYEHARWEDLESVLQSYKYTDRVFVDQNLDQWPYSLIAGRYFHPVVLLDLAQWVSSEAFVDVAIVLGELFNRYQSRKTKLSNMLRREGLPISYEMLDVDPPKCLIRYSNLAFVMDKRGWFDASAFCCPNDQRLRNYERGEDFHRFRQYLTNKGRFDQSYYHPLLFLLLARWVDLDYFVMCVRIVFCNNDVNMDALFRNACQELRSDGYLPSTSNGSPSVPMTRQVPNPRLAELQRQLRVAEDLERQKDAELQKLRNSIEQMKQILRELEN